MNKIGGQYQGQIGSRRQNSNDVHRLQNVDFSSPDKMPLSKNYIPYLPRRVQAQGPNAPKVSDYIEKLNKLGVPLPTSQNQLYNVGRLNNTTPIKIIKPRESQINVNNGSPSPSSIEKDERAMNNI